LEGLIFNRGNIFVPAVHETYSWDVFADLIKLRPQWRWESIHRLIGLSQLALIPRIQECEALQSQWVEKLRPVCGEQATLDWSRFRPLRLSREEDWSDWLAWLLEASNTGVLAKTIFEVELDWSVEIFIRPSVRREVIADDRRADIVARWGTGKFSQIEVKLWDKNFAKTYDTSQKLRSPDIRPQAEWWNFILIPREAMEAWKATPNVTPNLEVKAIYWDDVVRGLRRCLWSEIETVFWRAWAWTFSCAIEREILGLRPLGKVENSSVFKMQMTLKWLTVLNPELPHYGRENKNLSN
jgi:hypothetical protein